MEAEELRIGNLLMWEDPSLEIISVTEILKRENYYSISFTGGCAQLDEFIPIPLTEEWLNKFGFKKTTSGYWSNGKLEIGYTTTDEWFEYEYLSVSKDNIASTEMAELKYVHELQNLYFALTGKQLVITNNQNTNTNNNSKTPTP